ncbi:MAG: pq loop repeat protein [Lasallia pustulata]|uniref:Pq loop repeat protein n=1 Tax=Lasallia pustulata TaxID=136370 RepID=A0A5M8PVC0_9LECA|nr:MAG: pq loop repeat protein [Lasallia pustulata]
MPIFTTLISALAPIFLVLSPITSYTDQILSIHRTRTSAGFSLDIPLIMLTASILKIFYWPGARYDLSLLLQAVVMLAMQLVLLKVALDNRPGWRGELAGAPFQAGTKNAAGARQRLWGFWRWRSQRPYWEFLAGLVGLLALLHLLLRPTAASLYTQLIGYVGLAVEAVLPLPQMVANTRARSCKGFRVSVLANWLVGDAMKMSYFFTSAPGRVPWAFKACGIFQACCDAGLGVQWWVYGDGAEAGG